MAYYGIGLGITAFSMLLYGITPFLTEGQDILAEICLGGSLLLLQVGGIFYVQYWHTISREVSLISNLFFLVSGAGIVIIIGGYNPWEIYYMPEFGYHQDLSLLYSAIVGLVLIFAILIMFVILNRVRTAIKLEIEFIQHSQQVLQNSLENQTQQILGRQTRLLNNKSRFESNLRNLTVINFFWLIGCILVFLGVVLPGKLSFNADSIGVLFFFLPQAYYLTRNKDLLHLLQVQKVKVRAKKFHESFSKLEEQIPRDISSKNVEALVKFIEKADALLYFQEKYEA